MAYYNGQKLFQVASFGPYIHSEGKNSAVQIMTDPERANVAGGEFSAIVGGSRNVIGPKASESLVSGGLNVQNGQDGFMFGYRGLSEANQSLTGGYRCTNKASESIQVGERLTIDGTITQDEDGNPKSNSRYNAQFGQSSSMGTNTVNCIMAGQGHTQAHSAKWNAVFGKTHNLGHHNECVNMFGASNITHNYLTDSTLIGYDHEAFGGTSTSNIKYDVYMFGHNSTNRDSNNTAHNNVYMLGKYLRAKEDDQVIVGAYNAGTANCWFEVGCGTSNERKTAFAVCQQGNNYWIEMNGKAVIPPAPASDGTYSLKLVIADGAKTYSWETA